MSNRKKALVGIICLSCLLLAALALSATRGLAATLAETALGRYVFGTGGGPAIGGGMALNGTIGQPFIGPADDGSTALGSGFWYTTAGEGGGYSIYLPLVLRES